MMDEKKIEDENQRIKYVSINFVPEGIMEAPPLVCWLVSGFCRSGHNFRAVENLLYLTI